jgi:putative hydrolase of the HAD superfamily
MTQAVFFDIGNTLLYPYPSVPHVCREILMDAGHDRDTEDIDRLMPLVDDYYEDRFREDDTFWTDEGETSQVWVGMYSLLCRELGLEEDAEVLARRVYDEFGESSRWRAYDDVRPALVRLKEQRGLKLGVISNWDSRLETLLEGLDLAPMFDSIISSATVGLHKPDPRIFEMACDSLGVVPPEAVHVGDHHYSDIVGASAVGMTAVLIDRFGDTSGETSISTLDELETFLGWEE